MPDNGEVAEPQGEEVEGEEEEPEDEVDPGDPDDEGDEEDEGEGDDAADSGDSGDATVGGSGSKGAAPASAKPADSVARPTGKDLVDLFSTDEEAQRIVAGALESLRAEQAQNEQARKDAEAFQELIEKGDYDSVGRQLVERHRTEQARKEVADVVLKEQFTPVYQKLFAEPEMQNMTAEEKAALDPRKFNSDAEYVMELRGFIGAKRAEAKMEAEVERRFQERVKAAENGKTAEKAAKGSIAGTPGATGATSLYKTSSDKLKAGFRAMIDPDGED